MPATKKTATKTKVHTVKQATPPGLDLRKVRKAANTLKLMGDLTRLQIVLVLAQGEMNVGDLSSKLGQNQPAVSHHLALLRHGSIIMPRRDGKSTFYSLTDEGEELAKVVKKIVDR